MNAHELKQAIVEDIDTLKALDIGIMESTLYYSEYRHLAFIGFLLMWFPTVIAGFLATPFQWGLFIDAPIYNSAFILLAPALLSLLWMTTYSGLIGQWVVFKHQIKPHLKTGDMLYNAWRPLFQAPYFVYVGILIVVTHFTSFQAAVVFQFGFLLLEYAFGLLIEMEVNRIGMSTLFVVMKDYFHKRDALSTDMPKTNP